MRYLKLANKTGYFFDPETRLSLFHEEIKPYAKIGRKTYEWIQGGGLLIVDTPETSKEKLASDTKPPDISLDIPSSSNLEDLPANDQQTLYEGMSWNELKKLAKNKGLKLPFGSKRETVIKQLLELK
jgi:hypothetical protein